MQDSHNLPDNFKSKIARLYQDRRSFTNDAGKSIDYDRLVIQVLVSGQPFEIELKADKKDLAILRLSDNLDQQSFNN